MNFTLSTQHQEIVVNFNTIQPVPFVIGQQQLVMRFIPVQAWTLADDCGEQNMGTVMYYNATPTIKKLLLGTLPSDIGCVPQVSHLKRSFGAGFLIDDNLIVSLNH